MILTMPEPHQSAAQKKLSQAFQSFESTLREMLTDEARRSIDGTLERLSHAQGPFRVHGVEVEVVIRHLTVEGAQGADGHGVPARSRRAVAARSRPGRERAALKRSGTRGRPPGVLRRALLEAFDADQSELTTDALREHLDAHGVKTNADNLHQHLRRLVQAGELQRTRRGVYRRDAAGTA